MRRDRVGVRDFMRFRPQRLNAIMLHLRNNAAIAHRQSAIAQSVPDLAAARIGHCPLAKPDYVALRMPNSKRLHNDAGAGKLGLDIFA